MMVEEGYAYMVEEGYAYDGEQYTEHINRNGIKSVLMSGCLLRGLPFSTLTVPSASQHCLLTPLLSSSEQAASSPLSDIHAFLVSHPASTLCYKTSCCAAMPKLDICKEHIKCTLIIYKYKAMQGLAKVLQLPPNWQCKAWLRCFSFLPSQAMQGLAIRCFSFLPTQGNARPG